VRALHIMELRTITPRQFEVYLVLVSTALPVRHVGLNLGMSHHTVNTHIQALFDLLGVSSRLELAMQYHSRELHPKLNLPKRAA
jgi:DNA-binding NarL/FixJ family response regulator